jgi:Amiloride-sensitive sodium channel
MESRFNFLFKSTSLHGFKLLSDDSSVTWKKGFTRVFWTLAFGLSFYFMTGMLANVIRKASESTAIMPDTSYLRWVNTFPAFSFCLAKGRSTEPMKKFIKDSVNETIYKTYNTRHFRSMQAALFLNPRSPLDGINLDHCLEMNDTCGMNLDYAKDKMLPKNCEDIFYKIKFLNEEVPCKNIFKLHQTEVGSCFIANSIYSYENIDDYTSLPLRYPNMANVDRTLEIHYKENDSLIYRFAYHSPEELPDFQFSFVNLRKSGLLNHLALKTVEFTNEDDVRGETLQSRKCRFPSEKFEKFSLPFNRANCIYLKRLEREMQQCNCTLPISTKFSHQLVQCNMTKIPCLDELARYLDGELKNQDVVKDCLMPNCITMDITKISEYEAPLMNPVNKVGIIKIEVISKPSLRYIRRVQFTKLETMGEQ